MFLLMGVVQATNKMDLPGEEICLRQIAANNSGNLPQWDYNRVPQKCPLFLNLYENKLYFLAENISVVSNVRIYEYINEIECANFCPLHGGKAIMSLLSPSVTDIIKGHFLFSNGEE